MVKLHTQKAKNQFREVKPQLTEAFVSLRSVLLTEIQERVAEQVPTKLFDAKIAVRVSEPILLTFDDFIDGLLRMDQ